MNGHSDVGWFPCRQIRRNGVLSIVDNKFIRTSSEDTTSVGVVHETIAITVDPKQFLAPVDGLKAVLDCALCTSVLELTHINLKYGPDSSP